MTKGILFNQNMVRAILDGRKTVTRRICKDVNEYVVPDMSFYDAEKRTYAVHNFADKEHTDQLSIAERTCPICPGDILYVRECGIIQSMKNFDKTVKMYFPADDTLIEFKVTPDEYERLSRFPEDKKLSPYWLTKQESRIWLKVTNVRVERLQEITEEQAKAEGAIDNRGFIHSPDNEYDHIHTAKEHFIGIWNSTIKKSDLDRYGWDASPWVWVIEFEQCEKPKGLTQSTTRGNKEICRWHIAKMKKL